jgi:hypothetical protein
MDKSCAALADLRRLILESYSEVLMIGLFGQISDIISQITYDVTNHIVIACVLLDIALPICHGPPAVTYTIIAN